VLFNSQNTPVTALLLYDQFPFRNVKLNLSTVLTSRLCETANYAMQCNANYSTSMSVFRGGRASPNRPRILFLISTSDTSDVHQNTPFQD